MILDTLKQLYKRDLAKLYTEIAAYQDEANLWRVDKNITNCGGNLCLHLIGNLNHYIGKYLGQTNYVRQRALEFSAKNIPQAELLKQVKATSAMIDETLNQLTIGDIKKEFPIIVFEEKMTVEFFLVHLTTHLAYHLGQINYHRRLLDK
ncbi:MAG: DinB family protein [Bacteroidota bacterium]